MADLALFHLLAAAAIAMWIANYHLAAEQRNRFWLFVLAFLSICLAVETAILAAAAFVATQNALIRATYTLESWMTATIVTTAAITEYLALGLLFFISLLILAAAMLAVCSQIKSLLNREGALAQPHDTTIRVHTAQTGQPHDTCALPVHAAPAEAPVKQASPHLPPDFDATIRTSPPFNIPTYLVEKALQEAHLTISRTNVKPFQPHAAADSESIAESEPFDDAMVSPVNTTLHETSSKRVRPRRHCSPQASNKSPTPALLENHMEKARCRAVPFYQRELWLKPWSQMTSRVRRRMAEMQRDRWDYTFMAFNNYPREEAWSRVQEEYGTYNIPSFTPKEVEGKTKQVESTEMDKGKEKTCGASVPKDTPLPYHNVDSDELAAPSAMKDRNVAQESETPAKETLIEAAASPVVLINSEDPSPISDEQGVSFENTSNDASVKEEYETMETKAVKEMTLPASNVAELQKEPSEETALGNSQSSNDSKKLPVKEEETVDDAKEAVLAEQPDDATSAARSESVSSQAYVTNAEDLGITTGRGEAAGLPASIVDEDAANPNGDMPDQEIPEGEAPTHIDGESTGRGEGPIQTRDHTDQAIIHDHSPVRAVEHAFEASEQPEAPTDQEQLPAFGSNAGHQAHQFSTEITPGTIFGGIVDARDGGSRGTTSDDASTGFTPAGPSRDTEFESGDAVEMDVSTVSDTKPTTQVVQDFADDMMDIVESTEPQTAWTEQASPAFQGTPSRSHGIPTLVQIASEDYEMGGASASEPAPAPEPAPPMSMFSGISDETLQAMGLNAFVTQPLPVLSSLPQSQLAQLGTFSHNSQDDSGTPTGIPDPMDGVQTAQFVPSGPHITMEHAAPARNMPNQPFNFGGSSDSQAQPVRDLLPLQTNVSRILKNTIPDAQHRGAEPTASIHPAQGQRSVGMPKTIASVVKHLGFPPQQTRNVHPVSAIKPDEFNFNDLNSSFPKGESPGLQPPVKCANATTHHIPGGSHQSSGAGPPFAPSIKLALPSINAVPPDLDARPTTQAVPSSTSVLSSPDTDMTDGHSDSAASSHLSARVDEAGASSQTAAARSSSSHVTTRGQKTESQNLPKLKETFNPFKSSVSRQDPDMHVTAVNNPLESKKGNARELLMRRWLDDSHRKLAGLLQNYNPDEAIVLVQQLEYYLRYISSSKLMLGDMEFWNPNFVKNEANLEACVSSLNTIAGQLGEVTSKMGGDALFCCNPGSARDQCRAMASAPHMLLNASLIKTIQDLAEIFDLFDEHFEPLQQEEQTIRDPDVMDLLTNSSRADQVAFRLQRMCDEVERIKSQAQGSQREGKWSIVAKTQYGKRTRQRLETVVSLLNSVLRPILDGDMEEGRAYCLVQLFRYCEWLVNDLTTFERSG